MLMNTIMDDGDVARFAALDDETPDEAASARAETRLRHHDGIVALVRGDVHQPVRRSRASRAGSRTCATSPSASSRTRRCARRKRCSATRSTTPGIGMTLVDPGGHASSARTRRWHQMLGYEDDDALVGRERRRHHPPRRPAPHRATTCARSKPARSDGFRIEKRLLRSDGETVWVALTVSTVHGRRRRRDVLDRPARGHHRAQGVQRPAAVRGRARRDDRAC